MHTGQDTGSTIGPSAECTAPASVNYRTDETREHGPSPNVRSTRRGRPRINLQQEDTLMDVSLFLLFVPERTPLEQEGTILTKL